MDPVRNPFSPGAGTPPPALAGRDDLIETARIAIARVREGRPAKSVLLLGLRGVGKTVLLNRMRENAAASGICTLPMEAPESRSLPHLIAPEIRKAMLTLSNHAKAASLARRALRALAGYVKSVSVRHGEFEMNLDFEPEPGLADSGDSEHDLCALLAAAGEAAQKAGTALALFIDELQYVKEDELATMIVALHHTTQRKLPVILIGAGLPQLRGRTGRAKSYAERMFDFPLIGPLDTEAARIAITRPLESLKVSIEPDAATLIFAQTQGYPYFLQEWGKQAWDAADKSPIRCKDVEQGSRLAVAELDSGFFRVRFERLTDSEKKYMRAMAELGPGPHRSGRIASSLGKKSPGLGPTRNKLIEKGMIWSPGHGETAFSVPMFDEFMRRIMPGDAPRMRSRSRRK